MSDKKFILGVIVVTLFIMAGGVLLASKMASPQIQATADAKVTVSETVFDWGTIGMESGKAEKSFEIKNTGSETLKLFGVKTSCDCTTAQLIQGNTTSPIFGMHTESSYVLDVAPGGKADLKVIFDPAYHGPTGVGPATRQITVSTNDPDKQRLNFILTAMVTK